MNATSHTAEEVTAAGNILASAPIRVLASTSSKNGNASRPSLFAADHIPTLYHRIQKISKLLIQASDDANSLLVVQSDTLTAHEVGKGLDDAKMKETTSLRPDITMGAMTEDDVTDGYEAALALSMDTEGREGQNQVKRTELAYSIVRESQALRDAFQNAQAAIDSMEGGEMDIEEQEALLKLLQDYSDDQK